MSQFTHIDSAGQPNMVDISAKDITERIAIAQTKLSMPLEVITALKGKDFHSAKGPVFQTAIIAGTMAVKRTSELIPLCHPLAINKIQIDIDVDEKDEIIISCMVKTKGKTGVEMEALTGSSIAALTIYDMCKALSHDIIIRETRLLEKQGGKNDYRHG